MNSYTSSCGQGDRVPLTRVTLGQLLPQEQARLRPILKSQMCHHRTVWRLSLAVY